MPISYLSDFPKLNKERINLRSLPVLTFSSSKLKLISNNSSSSLFTIMLTEIFWFNFPLFRYNLPLYAPSLLPIILIINAFDSDDAISSLFSKERTFNKLESTLTSTTAFLLSILVIISSSLIFSPILIIFSILFMLTCNAPLGSSLITPPPPLELLDEELEVVVQSTEQVEVVSP